ncbi:hypothetical protein [Bordetella tumulicola]|uniref:hypothetical protein n=1 Tax=Bordetella tumulicola TaxID=1649133 RepID=UPI0039EE8001
MYAVKVLWGMEQVPEAVSDIQEVEHFVVSCLSPILGVRNIRSGFALKQVKYQIELTLR